MKGDFHVRFRENLRVKLPWVTRLGARLDEFQNELRLSEEEDFKLRLT